MSVFEGITKADLWVLDHVFQPVADRLPDRFTAVDAGMNLLFGSLVLSATAIGAVVFLFGMELSDLLFNGLIWAMWLSFYLGVNRMKVIIRPGFANPLRGMFLGMRPLSLVFVIYSFWQSFSVPPPFNLALWFNTLANLAFAIGVYLVSCQIHPPERQNVWQRDLGRSASGL